MIDFNKYRQLSPFYKPNSTTPKVKGDITLEQSIMEFDLYQEYMPNTHMVYINDSVNPVLATFVDVSDLQTRNDIKWMLTSLKNKVYSGDIVKWSNHICMCIFDRIKNTENCSKVKVQPCNASVFLPFFDSNKKPILLEYPVIMGIYITDLTEKQLLPVDLDLLGMSIKYDDYTKTLQKQNRIFLYDKAMEIVGVDYTNVNFINNKNKGYIRLMLRVSKLNENDNIEKRVCDYYSYFPKGGNQNNNENTNPVTPSISSLQIIGDDTLTVFSSSTYNASVYNNGIKDDTKDVSWKITDLHDMPSKIISIVNQDGQKITISTKTSTGKIKIKAVCNQDTAIIAEKIITIKNLV